MRRLKVLIAGTSAVETLQLEELFLQTGYLQNFRYVANDSLPDQFQNPEAWDLLCVRYRPRDEGMIMPLVAPVLRSAVPPVFFFSDEISLEESAGLLNAGVRRVLPLNLQPESLATSLSAIFDLGAPVVSTPASSLQDAPTESLETDGGLQSIFETCPVGICILRLSDGTCLDCNQQFAQFIDWPVEEIIGRVPYELGINEEVAGFKKREAIASETSTRMQVERKVLTRQRQVRHSLIYLDRILWKNQACVLAILQDITEHEQDKEKVRRLNDELERMILIRTGALEAANRELAAEIGRRKAVEEISEQLEQIIWETPDIVAIANPGGSLRYLNKAGRSAFKIPERGPIGDIEVYDAYSPVDQLKIREEIFPQVLKHGIWRGDMQLLLPDGRSIPVSQVILDHKDEYGELQYFASIARDISDFKQVERDLLESREQYRTLAEAAHDFIFVVSPEGIVSYANRYACQALEVDASLVEGMSLNRFFPEDNVPEMLEMIGEVREIDSPVYTEGLFRMPGGEHWLGTWLVPVHNNDGKLFSILGIARDITEQRNTDEALKRALEKEKQLNEIRSNFFTMTSHQFRTPLSTILLSVELLKRYSARWDDQKRGEQLERMHEAALRMNTMLENILLVGRVESGHYNPVHKTVDLIAYCQRVVQEMTANDREHHRFEFVYSTEPLIIQTDPELLGYILDNLLSNAIKYSPEGSQVIVRAAFEDGCVEIEVSDEGIGIPENDVKKLFQPFQRASNTGQTPGTGIGLTIVEKSVQLLKGDVFFKSKEGQGTVFMVRFPAHPGEQVIEIVSG